MYSQMSNFTIFHVKGYKINLASAILVSPAIEAAAAAAAR